MRQETVHDYLAYQGLRQERDTLRAQVAELREALKRARFYAVEYGSSAGVTAIDAALEMSGGGK